MCLGIIRGGLIVVGDNIPSSQTSFIKNENLPWEWGAYLGVRGTLVGWGMANLSNMTGFWDAITQSLSKC